MSTSSNSSSPTFFLLSIVVFAILICYIHKYFLSCQTALRFIETSAVSMEPEHNTYQAKRWFERCFVCVACVSFYGLFIQCIICGKMPKMSHVLQFIAAPPPPPRYPPCITAAEMRKLNRPWVQKLITPRTTPPLHLPVVTHSCVRHRFP